MTTAQEKYESANAAFDNAKEALDAINEACITGFGINEELDRALAAAFDIAVRAVDAARAKQHVAAYAALVRPS
jgi:hypothetical protein